MDEEPELAESMDDTGLFQIQSPYESEDSRYSEDSYWNQDYLMESNSRDCWDYESYDETAYESLPLLLNETEREPFVPTVENLPEVIDVSIDALEENNNDPNNNMDSNEIVEMEEPTVDTRQSSEIRISIPRAESPRPGCSKDSLPLLPMEENTADERKLLERTRQIIRLLSTIHRDSILDAMKKNPNVATVDLKLLDLVPENKRFEFSLNSPSEDAASKSTTNASCDGTAKAESTIVNNATAATTSNAKRGPMEDICTIGCKKSSSDPDLSILPPKPSSALPVLKTTSHIPLPTKKVFYISKSHYGNSRSHETIVHRMDQQFFQTSAAETKTDAARLVPSGSSKQIMVVNSSMVNDSRGAIPKVRAEVNKRQSQNRDRPIEPLTVDGATTSLPTQEAASPGANETNADKHAGKKTIIRPVIFEATTSNSYTNNSGKASAAAASSGAIFLAARTLSPIPKQDTIVKEQPTSRPVCMEMYYKLRNIFPNVDPDYLKKLCPPEWGPGDRDSQFTPIVEYLLAKGEDLPPAPTHAQQDVNGPYMIYSNVDDVYENLLGIFPDADPHYLRDFAEKNGSRPDAVKEFVESKLEQRDYPTREQYIARLKITEQQRQYTTGFDIKQYLTIIPDPFTHFMDPKRKCTSSTVATEFLKSFYNKIRVVTISQTYTRCAYNLSRTADELERFESELKSKRASVEIPTEDILLLQEIAFIKHKAEIRVYIDNVKKAEEAEFKMLKEQNFLIECECCYDSECVPSKCSSCDNGHVFCHSCIIAGTNSKMGEGEARISCFVNCGSEFSLSVLQRVLAPTTFSILLKKRQAAEVMEAGLEGLVSCPFCHFASIPPDEDKVFKCLNPECTKESCRLCKELSHVPLKCDEVMKADKARHYIEERMTEALAHKCYKCNRAYFKEEGCNKITCPCGAAMCYLCDQPVKDYTHFRGEGSDATNLCPLYSDTIRLNAVAVHKVAEEVQMEVMKLNPNIKIDTAKLLPNIPRVTNRMHARVPNAEELPKVTCTRQIRVRPSFIIAELRPAGRDYSRVRLARLGASTHLWIEAFQKIIANPVIRAASKNPPQPKRPPNYASSA